MMLLTLALAPVSVAYRAVANPLPASQEAAVRIGILESRGSIADALEAGAALAASEVNAKGGVNGRQLRLIRLDPGRPWREGAALMARLIFAEEMLAVVGPTDAVGAHVAAQIATRRRLPVITLSPEQSLTQALDPWIFRGVPSDGDQARALIRWAFPEPRGISAAAVIPDGKEGRRRLVALQAACRDLGVQLDTVLSFVDSRNGTAETVRPSIGRPDILLLWLDPSAAIAFLQGLDHRSMPSRVVGSLRLDDQQFLKKAPDCIEGMALPLLHGEGTQRAVPSARGGRPELAAALGYDMVWAIVTAAQRTGSEPALVREGLARDFSLSGATGVFHFDDRGNRKGQIPIGVVRVTCFNDVRNTARQVISMKLLPEDDSAFRPGRYGGDDVATTP